ncbi:methyltransferase domain-containing protein [Nocardia sp. NPDC059240]|uniref:methyltransferase domain-containing protein n=1 Tax=Nocardia sp. NPDC059240 TaxID=3346786 RepID=UPI0036A4C4A6
MPPARRTRTARRGEVPDPATREHIDQVLTACCDGPTIDLACGSGRLADRLMRRGIAVLSVDLSPKSVAVTRSRGVPVLHRDLFARLPATGRWAYALLADGVVGLGGDPVRVLRRTRELLAPDGVAIVEFAPARADSPPRRNCPPTTAGLPWARVGVEHAAALATAADLRLMTTATVAGHDIAWLTRNLPG